MLQNVLPFWEFAKQFGNKYYVTVHADALVSKFNM